MDAINVGRGQVGLTGQRACASKSSAPATKSSPARSSTPTSATSARSSRISGSRCSWETTVGDDRERPAARVPARRRARRRGHRQRRARAHGRRPVAGDRGEGRRRRARALHEEWLARMEAFFQRRSRVMPPNNRKQAMLPAGAEVLDNPVGTACGFAVDIGKARFFFTPGVPRELRRMLEEQIIPRLLAKSGMQTAIYLKRFHSYGIGESHADTLLAGVEALAPDGSVKLGFRAHYPQLETKLTVRGRDMDDIRRSSRRSSRKCASGSATSSWPKTTARSKASCWRSSRSRNAHAHDRRDLHERADRRAHRASAGRRKRGAPRHRGARPRRSVRRGRPRTACRTDEISRETAEAVARAAQRHTGATHALAVLIDLDEGADRIEFAGTICLAIATRTRRRLAAQPHRRRPRLGAPGRGRDGPRLPAPLSAGPAGRTSASISRRRRRPGRRQQRVSIDSPSGYAASLTCTPSYAERAIASVNCDAAQPVDARRARIAALEQRLAERRHARRVRVDRGVLRAARRRRPSRVTCSSPPARLRVRPAPSDAALAP